MPTDDNRWRDQLVVQQWNQRHPVGVTVRFDHEPPGYRTTGRARLDADGMPVVECAGLGPVATGPFTTPLARLTAVNKDVDFGNCCCCRQSPFEGEKKHLSCTACGHYFERHQPERRALGWEPITTSDS
jgi:hypothetical protein